MLTRRDRKRLTLITLAQMATAFLDLFGVLLIGIVTALALSSMSSVPEPAVVQNFLGIFGLGQVDTTTITFVLASIAGFLLVSKSVLNMIITRRILRFLSNKQAVVSGWLAAGLLSRPLLQVQQRSSQETVYTLTTGVNVAILTVLGQGSIALSEVALLTVLLFGMLAISPTVTVFAVVYFFVIGFILQRILAARAVRIGEKSAHLEVQSVSTVQEALRMYREAVVSQRRGLYVKRFQDLRWQGAINQTDMQFQNLIPKYVLEIGLVFGAGLLAASQLFTQDLSSAVAVIAIFLAAGSRIVPSILRLQSAAILIRNASGQAAPTYELARELESLGPEGATAESFGSIDPVTIRDRLRSGHKGFDAAINICEVSLAYPESDQIALEGVSLSLRAGQSLALVGPTGAGKSTLADVILGVLGPDTGKVLICGLSPAEAISNWPGAVAYVPQEVSMLNGTVRENVALGLPAEIIDDDWVWDALNRAHLGDFLRDSREGINTLVGEFGVKFSGGQRQRLGIARALYTRPKLLVLDEATSALDAETEQAISQTLKDLEGEVTTVTIAHRLATVRHCDLVVYLSKGRVLSQGSFDEVRAMTPEFNTQAQLLGF
jgi:ABC-type multidrug transport system fused ATPase/permease subunit